MFGFASKRALVVCALALVLAGAKPAVANIIRVIGPTTVINEPEGLIKFDVAFDTVNHVYLLVWGTQTVNLHGQFLNANGQPLGAVFTIENLSGWVRVTYSAQQQKFMVGYTRITFWPPAGNPNPPQHSRFARFISFNAGNNTPVIGPEIFLDAVGSSPGNSTGVAYSPAYGVFFATWHKYVLVPGQSWAVPRSFVAAIDPNGTVLAINELTNPFLGQSDPNIACSNAGPCLVVGFAWNNATWGRLIDGPLGTPVGTDSWDIAAAPTNQTMGDGTVAYSALQDKFVVLYVRNFNTIWGNTVGLDGTATNPYVVLQSTPETSSLVGPGYGVPNLAYNSGTSSFLVSGRDYFGRSDAQETDSSGQPLFGSWDQLPPNGESEYVNTAADPGNARMALFDNQNFNSIRVALYEIGDPQLLNGSFSDGANNWFSFASPDAGGLTTNVTGGAYQFYRTLPVGGSNFAFIYQDTPMAFAAGTRLQAQFDLGNSSSVTRTLNVILHTNFADQAVCSFTLPANSPLRTYRIFAFTTIGWSRASILFDPQTEGVDGGDHLLDNVSLQANPSGTNTGTECVETSVERRDFNGDGKSDLVWQGTDGSSSLWLMDGSSLAGSGGLVGPATGWSVKDIGDFNGNGRSDILYQHTDGRVAFWLMDGLGYTAAGVLLGPATGWSVKDIGDFNGDGKSDIVWQHVDGRTALWLMDGPTYTAAGVLVGPATGWSVREIGDFNGDRKSDIVWQHTDGRVALWLMNGLSYAAAGVVQGAATGWSIAQIGDFNADGRRDILWQHVDGSIALWLMNGLTVASSNALIGPGTGWSVKRTGDFNGDGKSDIVFQHTDGRTAVWLMAGLSYAAAGVVQGAATGWSVVQIDDFDGDGKSDLVWQHVDGSVALWLISGLTVTPGGSLLGPGTGMSPVP